MRGKSRTIPILLLLATAILSQSLITPSAGLAYPAIYIDPDTTVNTSLTPGNSYTISIKTNYTGSDIWGYGFSLTYNPLVLEGVTVDNGDRIVNATHPALFNTTGFDTYAGKLGLTECWFDVKPPPAAVNVTSGPGVLANVTFNVVGYGDSDIKLGDDTKLIGYSGGFYDIVDAFLMPGNIGHSYFRNVADVPTHDIAVTGVEPSVNTTLAPASVSINVTVKNEGEGNASERFAVDVYYEMIHPEFLIGSENVGNLTSGAFWSKNFTWDTTYVEQGNQTIIAKAGPVARETDTADNQNETAWVNVYSPYIAVLPESKINPDLGVGDPYSVSIYTDYNATEVGVSNDVWGYNLTLTYNASVLEGLTVTNGGGVPRTYDWVGDNSTTVYQTNCSIMSGTETVTVNGTSMSKPGDYTINYTTGDITFVTAPDWVMIEVEYWYNMPLMDGATFTAGSFTSGELSLTSANVSAAALVSGPGVLATVTFNVTAVGESDIVLGNETVLIGSRNPKFNITMPHNNIQGFFINKGDAMMVKVDVDQPGIEVYPTGLFPFNVTVQVQNIWGAPNFTVTTYYTIGPTDYPLGTKSVTGLAKNAKKTLTFTVNMSGAPPGTYIVSAKVEILTGDHNELNDYGDSGDTVKASLLGDLDNDGDVDPIDSNEFLAAYAKNSTQPQYKTRADMVDEVSGTSDAPEGYIGPSDLSKFGAQFGEPD